MTTLPGVFIALCFVLVLMGLLARGVRGLAGQALPGRRQVPLSVVQRVPLGPRQGIALVRVGERVIAVSVGDGGVRPLLEVEGEARDALLAEPAPAAALPRALPAALRSALRSAVPLLLLLALPATLAAQSAPATRAGPGADATAGAAVAVAPTAEQVDQLVPSIAPRLDLKVGDPAEGGLRLSGTVGVVVMMGLLTLLPTLLLMMTGFTRILIVMHFLRQALGTQNAPPAHLVAALSLLLTAFVMGPTLSEVNRTAVRPWLGGQMEQGEMLATGVQPFRRFMLAQTRPGDLTTFMELSRTPAVPSVEQVPLVVLTSAFVTSELKTAFQIGFALFLPFIIIDLVVASVLMSLGMFMLPPAMIALPFKLLLFVLVDGWTLVVQGLVQSFH